MMVKINLLIMLMSNPIMSIPMVRVIIAINLKLFLFFLSLKIVKIEFKITLQSSFCLEFSIVLAEHDFLYFSLHISEWNKSKLPMFIKIYTIRRFFVFFEKMI